MGKGSNKTTTTSQQSYTPDPRISQAAGQAITGAESAAQLPFQMPAAPVAGFSPFQEQAFGQTQAAQGMSLPYFANAANLMQGSAAPISAGDVEHYYNPFAQNVTNQLQNIFGQQNRMATSNAVRAAGGVGADRIGVAQGNLANQQGLAAGQIYSGLYDKALAAAQQNKQMQAGAGFGMGQLGPAAQASYLQGTGALSQAGGMQQALQQQQQNALYQQRLAEIAYPFQTPQYLAGITGGLAPALGGSTYGTSTTEKPQPSPLNQILGIGGALLGTALGGPMGGMMGGSIGKGAGSMFGGGGGETAGYGPGSMSYYGGVPYYQGYRRGGRLSNPFASGGAAYGKIAEQRFANSPVGNPYASDSSESEPEDGYAGGGEVDERPPLPGTRPLPVDSTSIVPKINLPMGAGHAGAKLDLRPPPEEKQGSGGDASAIASTAMKLLPMLLAARGGAVNPFDQGQGFQMGGDVWENEGESFEPEPVQGIDAPMGRTEPHFSLGDVTSKAADFYGQKAKAGAEMLAGPAPDPQSPWNVQKYMPQAAQPFNEAKAAPPIPPQNPMAPPDERGFQPPQTAEVPMPQARPDIAGPSRFSPQTPPLSPQQIAQETFRAAQDRGIPPQIALALVKQESGFHNIRGAAGEYGPAQIMPGTARELGLKDPSNTYLNIHAGMDYLKQQYDKFGNWPQAVAAYNAGPAAVASGRIPASTQSYVRNILGGENIDMSALSNREGARNPFAIANQDMTLESNLRSPDRPYPDSRQRDWGQNLARSPWGALIVGGARMAQTTGPVGSALGAGIEAGMGHLSGQRKELRTEEDMNMKADALFQHAKTHLDKYQRMTPYESEISKWREAKAESPTAMIKNAKWLVENGIAPDLESAHRMVSSGINQPAVMERAIRAEKANIAKTPEGSSLNDQQLEALARKNVQERFETFSPRGPGTSKENPLPYEPDESKRKAGMYYKDADGSVKKWIA